MNDSKLITIDDESLEQVSGGTLGLLFCVVAAPLKIVGGLLSGLGGLLGGACAPACEPAPSCRPPRRGC